MKEINLIALVLSFITPYALSSFQATKVAQGLGIPWGIEVYDKDHFIVTSRSGSVNLVNLKSAKVISSDLSEQLNIHSSGQGGLLDIIKRADLKDKNVFYLTYSERLESGEYATSLARLDWPLNSSPTATHLFRSRSNNRNRHHYGSRLAFDELGHLFMSIGDRGERQKVQIKSNHHGKVLRFVLKGNKVKSHEIWSYGHRNPQGLYYDGSLKKLYLHEHGPRGGDELNLIERGQNYGWPIVSQGKEYSKEAFVGVRSKKEIVNHIVVYIPSIAPSDMQIYKGSKHKLLKNKILIGSMKLKHISVVDPDSFQVKKILDQGKFRVRSLQVLGDDIFFATDSGILYRVE